ncbi:hypothetical protein [Limnohabitans sp. DM1]|uniref:hypothetical protein n=1 Tax=Limnohabitans sp. DM1 TaxID=1597955 RepID=UPI000AEAF26D|nr:hypothetical protein [Limnohabitans sp. DM1]
MPPSKSLILRSLAVQHVKERLMRESYPRLQMTLIVALTAGVGLLSSFALLHLGVTSMAVRYPLALVVAYFFFLFFIWLWLRTKAEDYINLPDWTPSISWPKSPTRMPDFKSGGGGDFAGGGATGSFDDATTALQPASTSPLGKVGDSVEAIADTDELAVPLLAITLVIGTVIGMALACLYVVNLAPVLFAEVLVDGTLSYALVRHLRGQEPEHWLSSTFRRTVLPFAGAAVFLVAMGAAMAAYAPNAKSIGEVLQHASKSY